jgi:DNA-binding CsgD family transcriptional regulator
MKKQPPPEKLPDKSGRKHPKHPENSGNEAEKQEYIAMLEKIFRKSAGIILVSENHREDGKSIPYLVFANRNMAHELDYAEQEMKDKSKNWLLMVTYPDDLHLFAEMDNLAGRRCTEKDCTSVFRMLHRDRKIIRMMLTSCVLNPEVFGRPHLYISTGLVLPKHLKNKEQIKVWFIENNIQQHKRFLNSLNERKKKMFIMFIEGLSDEEIGEQMHLSPFTVKGIRIDMYSEADVHSRDGLISIGYGCGIK